MTEILTTDGCVRSCSRMLRAVTHMGRYAEVFAHGEDADRFGLDDAV